MGLAPLFGIAGKGTRRTHKSRFAPALEPLEQRAMMAAFQPGDIAVVRIGTGASTLTAHPTEVYIDEYDPAGTLVQSIAMPTSGANAFTVGGTGFTDGGLSRSDNGQFLVAAGYRKDVSPLTTLPATDLSAATPRVVGRLAVNGSVDTTTALGDAYSGNTFRGVASSDGTSFYLSGANVNPSGGVRYVASLAQPARPR